MGRYVNALFLAMALAGSPRQAVNAQDQICTKAPYDISIVVDVSGSIYSSCDQGLNKGECWKTVKTFIKSFLNSPNIEISQEKVRVSITRFGTADVHYYMGAVTDLALDDSRAADRNQVHWFVNNMIFSNGNTPTKTGIARGKDQLLQNGRPGIPKLMIVITDGAYSRAGCAYGECWVDQAPGEISRQARDAGITLIAVGVSNYNYKELLSIVGGDGNKVITASSFNNMGGNVLTQLLESICLNVPRNGAWSAWKQGVCSTMNSCGQGTASLVRYCNNPYPNQYGTNCPQESNGIYSQTYLGSTNTLTQKSSVPCQGPPCPVNCIPNPWSNWGACTATCPGNLASVSGTQTRTRTIDTPASNGGANCTDLSQTRQCEKPDCPVNCDVSGWSAWANCDAASHCTGDVTTASGHQTRTQAVILHPANGGTACPVLSQTSACNVSTCTVDCQQLWSDWSSCNATEYCNRLQPSASGFETQTRTITRNAANGGKPCGPNTNTRTCSINNCPVDCRPTAWSGWVCNAPSNCPASRDSPNASGTQTRTCGREENTPANGGKDCTFLQETGTCTTDKCPVDCVVSAWAPWESCVAKCSDNNSTSSGVRQHTRTVLMMPLNGGKPCPFLTTLESTTETQQEPCKNACPVNCTVTQWTNWSQCNALANCDRKSTNATGTESRTRAVIGNPEGILGPLNGGQACPGLNEYARCNITNCPVDCVVGAWAEWAPVCTTTECKGPTVVGPAVVKGTTTRSRTNIPPINDGLACPADVETGDCYTGTGVYPPCSLGCVYSDWSEWSEWSAKCETVTRTRTHHVLQQPNLNNLPCNEPDETQTEDKGLCTCASDTTLCCEETEWSDWSVSAAEMAARCPDKQVENSAAFILVERNRARTYNNVTSGSNINEANKEQYCESLFEKETHPQPCPLDCLLDAEKVSACNYTCTDPASTIGSGQEHVTRPVKRPAANGGNVCDQSQMSFDRPCTVSTCPVDCLWAGWNDWTECTKSCAGGQHSRDRSIAREVQNAGVACDLKDGSQSQACNTHNCPINCELSDWSAWAHCDAPSHCDRVQATAVGTQTSSRYVSVPAQFNGTECDTTNMTVTEVCTVDNCPVDCQMSDWTSWQCDATDHCNISATAEGTESRTRTVEIDVLNGGKPCDPTQEAQNCTRACNVDCAVGEWSGYGGCSTTCGEGQRTRSRMVTVPQQNYGMKCPPLEDYLACTDNSTCPVACAVSDWSDWVSALECVGTNATAVGDRTRTRTVTANAQFGGPACPGLQVTAQHVLSCNVDCAVSDWSTWGPCDNTCGTGKMTRHREVTQPSYNNGTKCGMLDDDQECKDKSTCPINCTVADWSDWSPCDATCTGTDVRVTGASQQTRDVTTEPKYGGAACPPLANSATCYLDCNIDCAVSDWSAWSVCICRKGQNTTRSRYATTSPANNGTACPPLAESHNCTEDVCTAPTIVVPADKTPVIAGAAVGAAAAAALAGLGVLIWARKAKMATLATMRALEQDALFNTSVNAANPLYEAASGAMENPLYGAGA